MCTESRNRLQSVPELIEITRATLSAFRVILRDRNVDL